MITTAPMDRPSIRADTTTEHTNAGTHENRAAEVTRLRTDIEDARDGMGFYFSDLGRRRHRALDLRLQLQKHKTLGITVGVVTVAAAAGAVAMVLRSRRNAARGLPWSAWRAAPSETQPHLV